MTRAGMAPATLTDRFWSKVEKTPTCWLWKAGTNQDGYARFSIGRSTRQAHRFAYETLVGPIPAGLTIDHLCRVRHCVNPAHLEPVDNRTNVLRGTGWTARNARKTHCYNGHALSPDNVYIHPSGGYRECRTCRRARQLTYDFERRRTAQPVVPHPPFEEGSREHVISWVGDRDWTGGMRSRRICSEPRCEVNAPALAASPDPEGPSDDVAG